MEVRKMTALTHLINKDVCNLRSEFGCSQEIMGRIVGVTGRTIARWESEESDPYPLARQQIKELRNVLKKMDGVIKKGMEKEWLNAPNEMLENKTPLEVIEQGPAGIQEVVRLLGRLEWGIAA